MEAGGHQFARDAAEEMVPMIGWPSNVTGVPEPVSREEFFASYCTDPTAAGLVDFLFDREVPIPPALDLSNANTASLAALSAFQSNDAHLFKRVYEEASRRSPQPEVSWLMNDPFLFGLVLGVRKFNADPTWVERALHVRIENTTGDARATAMTLLDVLTGNWTNATNIRPLTLVAKSALANGDLDANLLDAAYQATTRNRFPFSDSAFLNAVYLRAFDLVILAKAPENPTRKSAVDSILTALWRRAAVGAWAAWTAALVLGLGAAAWLVLYVHTLPDGAIKSWVETLAILGIPLISIFPFGLWVAKRRSIITWIQWRILRHAFAFDIETLTLGVGEPRTPGQVILTSSP